jgi:hypothetical protein
MCSGFETAGPQIPRCRKDVVRRKGQVLDARSELFCDEVPGQRAAIFGAVHGDAELPGLVFDDLAADHPGRIDNIDHRRFACFEDRRVEQQPGQHFLIGNRLGDMVDTQKAGRRRVLLSSSRPAEVDLPEATEIALVVDEIEQPAADAANGRNSTSPSDRLKEGFPTKRHRPRHTPCGIVDQQPHRIGRRAVHRVGCVGKADASVFMTNTDVTLLVEIDLSWFDAAVRRKPKGVQQMR